MEKQELLNYYDENHNKIGVINREEGIKQNLLLEAVQIWIINPKNQKVLMQKRSREKETDTFMIDVSTSGHVKENESPTQAILREVSEEIGIKPEELYEKIQELMTVETDFTKLGRQGRYFIHEYIAYVEHPLSYYTKQDEEVSEIFFMDYEEVKQRIRNKEKNIRIPYNEQTEELFSKIDEKLLSKEKTNEKENNCR